MLYWKFTRVNLLRCLLKCDLQINVMHAFHANDMWVRLSNIYLTNLSIIIIHMDCMHYLLQELTLFDMNWRSYGWPTGLVLKLPSLIVAAHENAHATINKLGSLETRLLELCMWVHISVPDVWVQCHILVSRATPLNQKGKRSLVTACTASCISRMRTYVARAVCHISMTSSHVRE